MILIPEYHSFWVDPPGLEFTVVRKPKWQLVYGAKGKEKKITFRSINSEAAVAYCDDLLKKRLADVELPIYLNRWVYLDSYIKMGFWVGVARWRQWTVEVRDEHNLLCFVRYNRSMG